MNRRRSQPGLNYHQLYLFWRVAQAGGVSAAAKALGLTQPTVSAQLGKLQDSLGQILLKRRGRTLELTSDGRFLLSYCNQIFELGKELESALGESKDTPRDMVVGVADAVPKLVVSRLLAPLFASDHPHNVQVHEWNLVDMIERLRLGEMDLVLSEEPAGGAVREGSSALVCRSRIGVFGSAALAAMLGKGFPASLDNCAALLPTSGTALRAVVEGWCFKHAIRMRPLGSIDDAGLIAACAPQAGAVFFTYASLADDLKRQFDLRLVGVTDISAEVYLISMNRSPWRKTIQRLVKHARAVFQTE